MGGEPCRSDVVDAYNAPASEGRWGARRPPTDNAEGARTQTIDPKGKRRCDRHRRMTWHREEGTPASRRWLAAEYVGCRAGRASQAVGEARVRRRREAKELARRCPTARPHGEPHIFHKSTVDRGPAQCFSWRHRAERYQKSAFHVRRLAACAQRCAIQALRAPAFTAPAFTRRHGRIPLVTHLSCRGGLTIGAFTAGTCCASARK